MTTKKTLTAHIHIVPDFAQATIILPAHKALMERKIQDTKSEIVWIEDAESITFFVKANAENDVEKREKVRKSGSTLYSQCVTQKVTSVEFTNHSTQTDGFAVVEGFILSSYAFDRYKSEKKEHEITAMKFEKNFDQENIDELCVLSNAIFKTRDFVNEPVCALNAPKFAQEIEQLFANTPAKVTVYDEKWIAKQNMGGIIAVNKGSVDPARFVHIEWNNAKKQKQPIVLVGKGITYDTGGLSLKPASYMETMKGDMAGAATVVGVLKALIDNNVPVHIHALLPLTDNRPGGNATAPDDIITMHNGSTVEVLNTDAEGRLILADALSYAKTLNPMLCIDVATLTGAAQAAVGDHAAVALGTASQELQTLKETGLQLWEPLVEFPLWDMYAELLKSEMADMKNIGGQYAGTITAAKFLQKFTDYPWIHIDIAGSAYLKTKYSYKGVGATGWGVRLLFEGIKKISKK
ncbi:MAG: leucyl aminopeptidase family protein [Bacteroidales bacterium]|jgi:leucyl aminopeptidase|nr:leucyl aminopeptidase family protein [Bacteroidales bacterium]